MVLNKFFKKGFTLVELLIVMTIVALAGAAMVGTLNPIKLTNRAYDAQRKKDLKNLRTAMEEYFSDRGCYPSQVTINSLVCNSINFQPWVKHWPCEPPDRTYKIYVENNICPRWFKILTDLKNKDDRDIPSGWYSQPESKRFGDGTLTKNDVNYGVSSTNINWYE